MKLHSITLLFWSHEAQFFSGNTAEILNYGLNTENLPIIKTKLLEMAL
jgi:hypothetical protein